VSRVVFPALEFYALQVLMPGCNALAPTDVARRRFRFPFLE
jgi:hypothetical protein